MEELRKRLAEQKGRHQGGSKWIGTAGTSPYGAYGYNPAGVRIGQKENRNFRAIKVWDKRAFRDLDDTVELGTRNIKVALRRLRPLFARRRGARPRRSKDIAHKGYLRADAARAAQHGEGGDVLRRRRLHGLAHQVVEGCSRPRQRFNTSSTTSTTAFTRCLEEQRALDGRRPRDAAHPSSDYKVTLRRRRLMSP